MTRTPTAQRHDTAEGLVLYTSVDDTVHQLNAMSSLIYELADGRSLDQIARSFAAVFALEGPDALDLVRGGVDDMTSRGLLA